MLSKLQYISQGDSFEEQTYNIRQALDHGCDWIQLRFKKAQKEELLELADTVKLLCDTYSATFIINDHVDIAHEINADGIHLGLTDMKIEAARAILGKDKIIGGTANTLEEVLQRVEEKCDYIGLGPFQFTTTKENLSPILGLEGYKKVASKLATKKIKTPIYAIGGIQLDDVRPILKAGIYGVAVSGLLTQNPQLVPQLNSKLYDNIKNRR
ncbi:thiamine phosphate synthase [Flavobacterium sp. GCM10027622]|uniref:thiamine phosphate synthase n=1 Tax=unclassified Flavobacterium TaxID=196869 RepID=UPI00361FDEF4